MDLSSLKARLGRRVEPDLTFAVGGTALYTAGLAVAHAHHAMWRDEIYTWMVARSAAGLGDLLTGDRIYFGHPFLPYYLVYLVTQVVKGYQVLHWLTVACAAGAAFLWLRSPSFPRYVKVLLLASYYLAFEYTVLSRNYVLGVLLAFLFCALYHPLRVRYVRLASVLVLLAATSVYGTILATALALFLFLSPRASSPYVRRVAGASERLLGAALFAGGLAFTVATTLPPDDGFFAPVPGMSIDSGGVGAFLERYWLGMVPVPAWDTMHFWNTNVLLRHASPLVHALVACASAALLLTWLFLLRKRPLLLATYLVGVAAMALVQHEIYIGLTRHFGHYFLFLVVCLWLYVLETRPRRPSPWLVGLFVANLAAQLPGSYVALSRGFEHPFSGAQEAAELIRSHGLEGAPFVAAHDGPTSAVGGYLDGKAFFFPETNEDASHVVSTIRRRPLGPQDALEAARDHARAIGQDPLLLTNFDVTGASVPGIGVELLFQTRPAIVADEQFFVYRTRTERP